MPDEPCSENDSHELFVKLFARHESDLRRFLRSLLPTAADTDEVLQQTAIVIWRKFEQYDPDTIFMKWACVIARFEALAYRRKKAREKLVFREDILELMASEGEQELELRREEQMALDVCLKEMKDKDRRFIVLAHTPGVKVKDLAEQAGSTAAAFYMRVNRLRRALLGCVNRRLRSKMVDQGLGL